MQELKGRNETLFYYGLLCLVFAFFLFSNDHTKQCTILLCKCLV
jgi:hypothetical protein